MVHLDLTHRRITINECNMHVVTAGCGYPLVLLHGWPQSWYEWRRIIPGLADRFTVIVPDLRGLGDSSKPSSGYDKRTIASDVKNLIDSLGYTRVGVIGHDWGATVALFLASDNPGVVERLVVLDSPPGLVRADAGFSLESARRLGRVIFQGSKPDWAADLMRRDVRSYITHFLTSMVYGNPRDVFSADDLNEYVRINSIPGAARAGMEWYAAGLRRDAHDLVSIRAKLHVPVLAYGGEASLGDLRSIWTEVATDVSGGSVENCGHFIPEETPEFLLEEALAFFGSLNAR
jgi:pimeloyl-ACP methyl ester carboxylesterase